MNTGIYIIINKESNKVYVGQTGVGFNVRWGQHRSDLRGNRHGNPHLQRAWNKYGESVFEFIICEYVDDKKRLHIREQYWLDFHRMLVDTYNYGESIKKHVQGHSPSKETRTKLSLSLTGRILSKEHRRRIGDSHRGRNYPPASEETRLRMSKSQTGHPVSDETKERISITLKGKMRSKEHCHNISTSKGRPYPAFIHKETGEIIPAGVNLEKLCRERKLEPGNLRKVTAGKYLQSEGWVLLEGACGKFHG